MGTEHDIGLKYCVNVHYIVFLHIYDVFVSKNEKNIQNVKNILKEIFVENQNFENPSAQFCNLFFLYKTT